MEKCFFLQKISLIDRFLKYSHDTLSENIKVLLYSLPLPLQWLVVYRIKFDMTKWSYTWNSSKNCTQNSANVTSSHMTSFDRPSCQETLATSLKLFIKKKPTVHLPIPQIFFYIHICWLCQVYLKVWLVVSVCLHNIYQQDEARCRDFHSCHRSQSPAQKNKSNNCQWWLGKLPVPVVDILCTSENCEKRSFYWIKPVFASDLWINLLEDYCKRAFLIQTINNSRHYKYNVLSIFTLSCYWHSKKWSFWRWAWWGLWIWLYD